MKNKHIILLLSLFTLAGCGTTKAESLPAVEEGNIIHYTDTYTVNPGFEANKNTLVNDQKTDAINYFLSNGSHFSQSTDYIFLYKDTLKGRDFKVSLTYDSSKEYNAFLFGITWNVSDPDNLPYTSFYFTSYFNLTDFKSLDFSGYYEYDYTKDKEDLESYVKVSYTDIDFGSAPMINSATFTRGLGTEMPSRAVKKDDELGASVFECIRVGAAYLESFMQAVSSNYHAW